MLEDTPITLLENTNDVNENNIFIKREDLYPYSFGGNKARKGILFFKEIDEGGYDYVLTYGSSKSNHCRVVANLAAGRGLKCCIIGPEEDNQDTYNSRLLKILGAECVVCPLEKVHSTIEDKLQELRETGFKPYFISGGGHGIIGTQTYLNCYEEIKRQEQKLGIYFDYIFHASGTGTTQAGLVCGQLINDDTRKIVGISIARKNPRGALIVIESVKEYLLHNGIEISESAIKKSIEFVDDYIGLGYGDKNTNIEKTFKTMFIQNGIPMDVTYTAKAFNGMHNYIEKKMITGKNILFIHTGGTPLFFDDIKNNS